MADTVLYEVTDSLATVTLNRPDAMNALDVATKEALRTALQRAGADSEVRAVLLTGRGRAFCVGQDLKEHIRSLPERDREPGEPEEGATASRVEREREPTPPPMPTVVNHYNPITTALAGMLKPVVAAVNGPAAGAGFGFALAADYRVVAESATFNTAFAGIALTADSGLSWSLPRFVGHGRARDLLLFPRSIDAAEAERLGIAQRVVPDDELPAASREVAERLARGPSLAYAAIKESLIFGEEHTLTETLEQEARLQGVAGASWDHHRAVAAFLHKREATYEGR